MKIHKVCFFLLVALLTACREAYDPALENGVLSYLVVEGHINAGGITTIELSRTQRISEKEVKKIETKAVVEIESDNNNRFPLSDKGDGSYTSSANVLPRDRKYRLRIKTSAGKEYLSDFAAVKVTQPVTVSWKRDAAGVDVTANSSDPAKQSLYYQWKTEETWEIIPPLRSFYRVTTRTLQSFVVANRTGPDQTASRQCWTTVRSANILTASTIAQADDVISGFSLVKIPNGSGKLDVRYSVLVDQYAISREAYEFYGIMKKNSEKLGSLFDPLPSLVRGNITCTTDPKETVIGFVEVSIPTSQRIFITSAEAGNWEEDMTCQIAYVPNATVDLRRALPNDDVLIADALKSDTPAPNGDEIILGYNIAAASCLDCRVRGNNVRPAFW